MSEGRSYGTFLVNMFPGLITLGILNILGIEICTLEILSVELLKGMQTMQQTTETKANIPTTHATTGSMISARTRTTSVTFHILILCMIQFNIIIEFQEFIMNPTLHKPES